jgi:hypothetical protein
MSTLAAASGRGLTLAKSLKRRSGSLADSARRVGFSSCGLVSRIPARAEALLPWPRQTDFGTDITH